MPVYKDEKQGTWFASFYYQNWKGERIKKMKRGFQTKRAALDWEREFLQKTAADLSMTFKSFVELYIKDMRGRIREHTWQTKENIIQKKLIPYFGRKKMNEIQTKDVIAWQNEMLAHRDAKGKGFSDTYLKTLHNQLSAVLNHAVRHYDLKSNVASKVGPIGKKEAKEMLFWTKDEYLKFADAMMDKPVSYYAFEILYWCGLRLGELLALTPADFDFGKETISVTKSYQRLHGEDVVTEPKTAKSNRVINMPKFICEEIQEYLKMLYGVQPNDRIFTITKSYLHHEMDRGSKAAGVKRIRIHDLRHSHVSLLIEMGFSALAIADRVGHPSRVDFTNELYPQIFMVAPSLVRHPDVEFEYQQVSETASVTPQAHIIITAHTNNEIIFFISE
ncbi:MAG: putative prophage phiRv2 integrase [Firmicutes bacterium ADurb.Bin248]|nr:MAG: putative prophage phiRv2 integrase [Firmicutes bacterium ADurb.Bin248]HPK15477.1 site-specific integrase [Clostridia bacterium]